MIGPGRFEHDTVQRRLREPFDERFVTSLVIGETPGGAVGQPVGVEMVFRHIDADGIILHLFRAFACHSGLAPEYPYRPKEKTRAIQLLLDPQTVSLLPIRPSPLSRGLPPSPSGSFSPLQREKS